MNTTPDAEMPDSYAEAWIVELKSPPPMQGPTYWGLDDDEAEGIGWTHDHLRAQRFSRKEDAEMMIEYFGWTEAHAVEHAWGFPPKAPSPSVERMPDDEGLLGSLELVATNNATGDEILSAARKASDRLRELTAELSTLQIAGGKMLLRFSEELCVLEDEMKAVKSSSVERMPVQELAEKIRRYMKYQQQFANDGRPENFIWYNQAEAELLAALKQIGGAG